MSNSRSKDRHEGSEEQKSMQNCNVPVFTAMLSPSIYIFVCTSYVFPYVEQPANIYSQINMGQLMYFW